MFRTLFLICLFLPGVAIAAPDYVGSEACVACHTEEAESWRGSHHDLAWTEVDEGALLGDFSGSEFSHDGTTTRFDMGKNGPLVTITEKDGSKQTYPVHSVVGIEPLQQYLIHIGKGALQSLDVVWDTRTQQWFHLYPEQDLPPGDGLHWTGPYKNWNARCAECHATGYEKRYDLARKSYDSQQAEIGVGCEACHGPGSDHLDWLETGKTPDIGLDTAGFLMDFDSAGAEVQQCATCHARREPFGDGNPLPGADFHDSYRLSLLRPDIYHADGAIMEEVYVYGSFLQSKMHDQGVQCSDCHDPHTTKLRAEGNAVCAQCHSPAGNPDFPTLKLAEYDEPAHTHHPEGSAGAMCKNCHMVERTFMGNDDRADHAFRIPRPDLSAETGAPNACTTCHDDQTPDWAAQVLDEWFPGSTNRGAHFSQVFARSAVQPDAQGLLAIADDPAQPAILRASALSLLAPVTNPELADLTEKHLNDADPMVRAQAVRMQRGAQPVQRIQRIDTLLDDPMQVVRQGVVREMLDAPIASLPPKIDRNFRKAQEEWLQTLEYNADFPETHMILGGRALVQRNVQAALAAFSEAVRMDPQLENAWGMLVRIHAATGNADGAKEALREGLDANPQSAELTQYATELGITP